MRKISYLLVLLFACGDGSHRGPPIDGMTSERSIPVDAIECAVADGCGPPNDSAIITDAVVPSPDAARPPPPDAGICSQGGCYVANLPTARSITINTGDPIPPALPNELQDQFPNGGRRSAWTRAFYPRFIYTNTGGFNGSSNGQPCQISSAATIAFFDLPYDIGDRITGLAIDVFGGGGSTLVMHIDYTTAPGVAATVLATVPSFTPAAAWNQFAFAVTPQIMAPGSYLHVDVTTSAAGLYLGRAFATYDRLP